jgi:hypothetical protein
LLRYEELGLPGERLKYIAKLSKETKLSDNSLRRYIAAAQFLEAEGITEIKPGTRLPVAAVERIARIAAFKPGSQHRLLHEAQSGMASVEFLGTMLKGIKKTEVKARLDRLAEPSRPLEEFADLADAAKAELASRGVADVASMKVFPFDQLDTSEYFEWQAKPVFAIKLPEERRAAVMDDRTPRSFVRQRKEFKRNILCAATFYDYVLVYAPTWQAEIEKLRKAVLPSIRERIISLDLDEPS